MSQTEQIRVIIADDHDLYRDGLKLLLSKEAGIRVVGEAINGLQLIELCKKHSNDVVITDLFMPECSGVEAIKFLFDSGICKQTIALSTFDSDYLVLEALEAGASGFINKNAQRGEIVEAIETVSKGFPSYCRSTSDHLVQMMTESQYNPYKSIRPQKFTEKELDIIRLVCEEKTNEEIARDLLLGKRNVEAMRAKIMEKTHTRSTIGLVIYAVKNGIYKIPLQPQNLRPDNDWYHKKK